MDLQILISKKGTKVVTATNLYAVLQLPEQHYGTTVKKWLNDIYEYEEEIRKPLKMKDFAKKKIANNTVIKDYYLTIELAKKITLRSKSKVKLKFAKILNGLEEKKTANDCISQEQIETVLELAKAMGRFSFQETAKNQHQKMYTARNGGSTANWWKHRSRVLGYSAEGLRQQLKDQGRSYKGKTQRQMLLQIDKYEIIRSAVVDLFIGMGKTEGQATKLGNLAKVFAREMNIEVFDDRKGNSLFASTVNKNLLAVPELAMAVGG